MSSVATSTKTTSPTSSTSTVSSSSTLDQRTDQMPQPAGTFTETSTNAQKTTAASGTMMKVSLFALLTIMS